MLRIALVLSLVLLFHLDVMSAQPHPDFSGTWAQVNERCDPKPRNSAYSYKAVIEESDSVLHVSISVTHSREDGDLQLNYEIGGKELVYTGLDHDQFHSRVEWNGDSLVFHILEFERGKKIAATETWTLSDGGRTLTRVKEQNEPGERNAHRYVLVKSQRTVN